MKVYKKLFQYVPNDIGKGFLAIGISAFSACLMVYGYYLIYMFLKEICIAQDYSKARIYAVQIVVSLTSSGVLYILAGAISHKFAFRLETSLRKKGIDGLTRASFRFFDLHSSGYIRKTIDDNAAKTHTAVAHMLPDNSQAALVPILSLVLGFLISWRVGVIMLAMTAVSGFVLKGMMGNGQFMKLYQESLDRLSTETVDYIRGMQVVKIFGNKLKSFKSLHKAIVDYSQYAYDYSLSCKKSYVVYQLIFLGIIPIIAIFSSFFMKTIKAPQVFGVELIMIFFLTGVMMVSFMKIMWAGMNIFNANYAIDHLEELYKEMQQDELSYGSCEQFAHCGITFNQVSFSYGDKKVLHQLSFSLEEKKTYALVGHSGSGKSTVAKLLSGFYKVDAGSIQIGDRPIEDYTKEAIIHQISFVFQNSRLFKKTIYDNVALANKKASKEEVMEAMRLGGCDSIIEKFPQRENTLIGSKGVYLSGGERQRIAIARAILKNSPIVVMDEASAAIDADNEYELQKAFKNLMKDKTVIMIAHRLSSIQNVDEILVLENGQLVERGDSTTLLEKQGVYSRLMSLYKSANDWRVVQ